MTYSARKKASVLPGCWVRLLYSLPPCPLKILAKSRSFNQFFFIAGGRLCGNPGSPALPPSIFFSSRVVAQGRNLARSRLFSQFFFSLWAATCAKILARPRSCRPIFAPKRWNLTLRWWRASRKSCAVFFFVSPVGLLFGHWPLSKILGRSHSQVLEVGTAGMAAWLKILVL